jgi:hypothetical protein
MKLKLSDWASIAEVVSGIAVVVTLVFLIAGIRANTEVTRASMFQRSTDRIIEWRRDILNNPEVADLFQAYWEGNAKNMTPTQENRLTQLVLNQFQIYEQAYFTERYGLLGQTEWRRFQVQACTFYPRVRLVPILEETVSRAMTPEFGDFLKASCQE